jgi:hypothetical protein
MGQEVGQDEQACLPLGFGEHETRKNLEIIQGIGCSEIDKHKSRSNNISE